MSATALPWLAWMAAACSIYWLSPARFRDLALIFITACFLIVHSPESLIVLSAMTLMCWVFGSSGSLSGRRLLMLAGGIVAVLVIYKLRIAKGNVDITRELLLPLGVSYYSFRCLHYLIERYRDRIPAHDAREFVGYLFFLPTLLVGPIHRFPAYLRERNRARWDSAKFADGLRRILYGYVKIMVLAVYLVSEQLGPWVEALEPTNIWLAAYLGMIEGAFYGYLLFAGYSDIAIGFGLVLGIRVMENFNWPFIRRNITEFWQAWHISLSSWVREYVYMTTVATTRNAALAAIVSMVVLGLWHEVSLRYVVWGACHGIGIAVCQLFQRIKPALIGRGLVFPTWLGAGLATIVTFHFVVLSFVIVIEPDLAAAFAVYRTLLGVGL